MPTPIVERITAWSFSRLHDYRSCPFKAYLKHVKKLREPPNAAMERGTQMHLMGQQVVEDPTKAVPPELQTFREEFTHVQGLAAREAEKELAFTRNWFPTDWFSPLAWVRLKIDLWYAHQRELHVVDFKSGKQRPEHEEQLSLYAAGGMIVYPEAPKVISHLWYFDQGVATTKEYLAAEKDDIIEAWEEKVLPMMTDVTFEPTPSADACRYCIFQKDRGGQCKY